MIAVLLLISTLIGMVLPYILKLLIDQSQFSSGAEHSISRFSLQNLYLLAMAYALGWFISQIIEQLRHMLSAFYLFANRSVQFL